MWKYLLAGLSFWMSFKVTPKKIADALESSGASDKFNAEFVAPEAVRAACVQIRPRSYRNLKDLTEELLSSAREATNTGAQVVVYPEYVGLLAAKLIPFHEKLLKWVCGGVPASFAEADPDGARLGMVSEAFHHYLCETYMCVFSTIARLQHIYVVAGSSLFLERGTLVNRCIVFGPDGEPVGCQEKVSVIGFDRAIGAKPSDIVEPVETSFGKLGVVLGTDAYYFECFKILAAKGARMVAVPACEGGVLPNLLRCRANESGVYALYSCYGGKEENARAALFSPINASGNRDGVVFRADADGSRTVCARTSLTKLELSLGEHKPNPMFLHEDYLHSYRYCGTLPMMDAPPQFDDELLEVEEEEFPSV